VPLVVQVETEMLVDLGELTEPVVDLQIVEPVAVAVQEQQEVD
jgi:hypothetical protein